MAQLNRTMPTTSVGAANPHSNELVARQSVRSGSDATMLSHWLYPIIAVQSIATATRTSDVPTIESKRTWRRSLLVSSVMCPLCGRSLHLAKHGQRKRNPSKTSTRSTEIPTDVLNAVTTSNVALRGIVKRESAAIQETLRDVDLRGRRGRRILNGAMLLVSGVAAVAAGMSLAVAFDTSTRDQLTATFTTGLAACITADGTQVTASANVVDTVVTNTGRLPITVIRVWDGGTAESFSWMRLDDRSSLGTDTAVELGVGQAIAVRVFTLGNTVRTPLAVLTSDGVQRDLERLAPAAESAPAVEAAYAALPSCSQFLDSRTPTPLPAPKP
jgi:hypothetical protein